MLHATCYVLHATSEMLHNTCNFLLNATCYRLFATCYMLNWQRGSCLSWLWLSWECNCWYQMVNKLRWRFKIISCIVTVRKISMPVMITSVVKSNPNDNFELSATTIVKMMEITICFLILFFKACWHAINLDNSADRVTSITLKLIFWYQEQY